MRFLALTANNREFSKGSRYKLSITRLFRLMLGLFKPDGIEFG
jgi:hypothetical protein